MRSLFVGLFASVCAKRIIFVASLLALQSAYALQSLPFEEHFPYTNNAALGSAGNGDTIWSLGGSVGSGLIISNTAALTYSGLAASSGNGVSAYGTTSR